MDDKTLSELQPVFRAVFRAGFMHGSLSAAKCVDDFVSGSVANLQEGCEHPDYWKASPDEDDYLTQKIDGDILAVVASVLAKESSDV